MDYNRLCIEAEEAVDAYDVLSPNERDTIKNKIVGKRQSDFVRWLVACGIVYLLELVAFLATLLVLLTRGWRHGQDGSKLPVR